MTSESFDLRMAPLLTKIAAFGRAAFIKEAT
jgi:hypothetical protein